MSNVVALRRPQEIPESFTHSIAIPNSDLEMSVEVELVPADTAPQLLRGNTNVARMTIGGREFFAVVGKTAMDPDGGGLGR